MPWTMEGEFNTYLTDARDGGVAPSFGEARFDPSRKYVRVNGERQGLVEFDFGVGDLTLSVEMLLSHEDFQRFCADEKVILFTAKRAAAKADEAAATSGRPSDVLHPIGRETWREKV